MKNKKSILICIPSFDTKIHLETISSIISVRDILSGLANDSQDPAFRKAIAEADKAQTKNTQNGQLPNRLKYPEKSIPK